MSATSDATVAYLAVIFVLMMIFVYFVVIANPVARNKEKFNVDELCAKGGWITVNTTKVRVEKGAIINVGSTMLSISQGGTTTRINFNGYSEVTVEVDP